MVTISTYQSRKSDEGKEFFVLILQSGIEIIKSQNGGMYATAKKASIPSTFTEEICKQLIGQQIEGTIRKVECEPYTYFIPETGEGIIRNHRYEYVPDSKTTENSVLNLDKPAHQLDNSFKEQQA